MGEEEETRSPPESSPRDPERKREGETSFPNATIERGNQFITRRGREFSRDSVIVKQLGGGPADAMRAGRVG
jgi:hypothetical protein